MRRIYDSDAIYRSDDEPGAPVERQRQTTPQSFRSINSTSWSRRLIPHWLRHRAISVRIETTEAEYRVGEPVPFRVTMKNAMPFPVTIVTESPLVWDWAVDDLPRASHVTKQPPDETDQFQFARGERKQFHKRWDGMFKVAGDEWERAGPGEYTLSASISVDGADGKGLSAHRTIRLRPE